MSADALKEAINLIKSGRWVEARMLLEPIIIANPQNIQAWVWEIETRENDEDKIKIMESCLQHNPDSTLIQNALTALKKRMTSQTDQEEINSNRRIIEETETRNPVDQAGAWVDESRTRDISRGSVFLDEIDFSGPIEAFEQSEQKSESIKSAEKPKINIQIPFDEFGALGDETVVQIEPCPFCGELIKADAKVCDACGRKILHEEKSRESIKEETQARKKWYRHTWVKILFFIFLMPVWCVLELSDAETKTSIKVLAGIIIAFYVTLCSLLLYWFFTTNTTRANLLNWYRSLTGQSQSTPGSIIQVEGNVHNSGSTEFGLVELQARIYDKDGNLLGMSTQYMGSSILLPGDPTRFQLDVTPLLSPLSSGLIDQQVLMYDDFSNSNTGWNKVEGKEGKTSYREGQFAITVNIANYDLWSNPGKNFKDVKIEVDATKQEGPESNRMGLQCRYQDQDNYYFAVISSDGYYGIGKVVDGTQSILPENGMRTSQTIFAGQALNHIRFDCVGTKLTLYVNGDYVDSVDDDDLSDGDVGLIAGTFNDKNVQVSFDNLIVLSP